MIRSVLMCASTLVAQGCAMTFELDEFTAYAPTQGAQHTAAVELCLAPGLATTVVRVEIADNFDAMLGPRLVANAEATARAAFDDVRVSSASADAAAAGDRGRLTVRFGGSATDLQTLYAFSEASTTIDLEWTLENRAGNVVWLGTIRGEGRANVGNAFTARGKAEDRFQRALDDVFAKSLESLRTSPEILAWVTGGS